jgi:aryl-alcohol dehydrogenase-like predicted oxidoreductase
MAMETRKIGSIDVSVVGLGTNNFGFRMDEADVPAVVDAALDAGITFFDTSDSYGRSERRLAEALGERHADIVLATKFASPLGPDRPGGARPEYIRSAVDRLTAWAEARGHSILELAIAWLVAKPTVASVIAGATTAGQVGANAAVTWRLSAEEVAEVDAMTAAP